MHNLYELMELEYQNQVGNNVNISLSTIINDEKQCCGFLRQILQDDDTFNEKNLNIAKGRAIHSLVVFLMGLVFSDFGDLFQKISNIIQRDKSIDKSPVNHTGIGRMLWFLTALYHDRGYFSRRLSNAYIDYKKEFKYYLLTDANDDALVSLRDYSQKYSNTMAFSYDEIISYDQYARIFHRNEKDEKEKVDHGILGGCIVFNDLIRSSLKNDNQYDFVSIKTSCITIAQHNIYKSENKEKDYEYPLELHEKLSSISEFRINDSTPLLLLLDIIDTIECCKRFSRSANIKYLQLKTVLQSIRLQVDSERITLDFSELRKRIEEKNDKTLNEVFEKHLNAIKDLNSWTSVKPVCKKEDIIELYISESNVSEVVA